VAPQKMHLGTDPDGTPHFHYDFSTDPGFTENHVALYTGPIGGTLVLADGTAYDVSEQIIAVHKDHVAELTTAIHKAHHAAGRFLDVPLPTS
jgi:hypothetical protein